MTATPHQLGVDAVNSTIDSTKFLTLEVREAVAIAYVAIAVDNMDSTINPVARLNVLDLGIATVREFFNCMRTT